MLKHALTLTLRASLRHTPQPEKDSGPHSLPTLSLVSHGHLFTLHRWFRETEGQSDFLPPHGLHSMHFEKHFKTALLSFHLCGCCRCHAQMKNFETLKLKELLVFGKSELERSLSETLDMSSAHQVSFWGRIPTWTQKGGSPALPFLRLYLGILAS